MINNAVFSDFNFKLAIIQELMYEQKKLSPQFDLYEFVENYKGREINIEEEGYDIIPEVKEYFEKLTVPKELLDDITDIYQDEGNDIYMQLCPFWNGGNGIFTIETTDDFSLLSNLESVTLFYYDNPDVFKVLRKKGIGVNWL
ncbi:hypothetical protein PV797_01510 [Clostridiaceae bacterium M8S5]|nr:hypothetical protein PV797_01510 [Clostridiaceae bacterium M8S5]